MRSRTIHKYIRPFEIPLFESIRSKAKSLQYLQLKYLQSDLKVALQVINIHLQSAIMKSVLYHVFAALAIGINAAPERTYISYSALAADRVPGSGGAASQANSYNRGCTVEERCFRDTGKRSDDVEAEVVASEVSGKIIER
jgi:hypothetical protein